MLGIIFGKLNGQYVLEKNNKLMGKIERGHNERTSRFQGSQVDLLSTTSLCYLF